MNGRSPNIATPCVPLARLPPLCRRRSTAGTDGTGCRWRASRRASAIAACSRSRRAAGHSVHGRSPCARVDAHETARSPRSTMPARPRNSSAPSRRLVWRCHSQFDEPLERRPQRLALQLTDRARNRCAATCRARSSRVRSSCAERRLAADRGELRHAATPMKIGSIAIALMRRVGRLLARRHLVDAAAAAARAGPPPRARPHGRQIADVADAPARRRRARKQRNEDARRRPRGRSVIAGTCIVRSGRRMRSRPSTNALAAAAGSRRETTRAGSRRSTRDAPARRPSSARSTTSSSSG